MAPSSPSATVALATSQGVRFRGLCLLAALAAACTADIGKLRAPASPAADAPMDNPVETELDGRDSGAISATADGADGPAGRPDLAKAEPDGSPDGADAPAGADGAADAIADRIGEDTDLVGDDVASEVKGDDVGVIGGTGGNHGTDDGGSGTGGAGMTEDAGSGGVGGTGGTGGSGGTGGTGGSDGTGGTGGRGGTGGTGGSGGTGGGGAGGTGTGVDPDLVLWYRFDEASGTRAADSSPQPTPHDGTLATYATAGTAAFSTDSRVGSHALSLTPSTYGPSYGGGYVTVPALQTLAPDALTIAVWVKLANSTSASQNWERAFDYGTGTTSTGGYFYLTTRMGGAPVGSPVRFGISGVGRPASGFNPNEQRLETTTTLTTNVWHHLAVVLAAGSPYTGILYIDGTVAVTNPAMTLHLSDLAVTANNWLGRSQFSDDPFFYGAMDDFRVYRRALSVAEISALFELR